MNSLSQLLVYDSSDSEGDSIEFSSQHKNRLPLPDIFKKNNTEINTKTQIENEDGKIRNFPHEPGNWATYVYVPVQPYEIEEFNNYFEELKDIFKPLQLKLVDDFHISLTRTLILRNHWIQDFMKIIKENLKNIYCFKINFCGLKAYTNDHCTRTFISLIVNEGSENLKNIVHHLDKCLKDYNLQPFYKDPSFHLSLFWCSGNKCDEIDDYINKMPLKLKSFVFEAKVSHCVCTSGNKNFTFNFNT